VSRYAESTTVSVEKSRAEIESTLDRYGADGFSYATMNGIVQIEFLAHERRVRFVLEMPRKDDKEFTHTPQRGTRRTDAQAYTAWEQACRQSWRALALVIKAKLEAVEAGISEFQSEFLAHVVLPNGQTVGQWMEPQVEQAYETGNMPSFLPELGTGDG
jgi:hypothetical protein